MNRFFIPPDLLRQEQLELPADVAQQVVRVLRLRAGARVALFCGDGEECAAVLDEVAPRRVTARITERTRPEVELACRLHAAVAVLKGEKLDWAVQKLVELGAARISLVQSERTVVTAGEERWSRRIERYQRIAREAAEQSGRVRVPEVMEPRSLAAVLAEGGAAARFFLHPGGAVHLAAALRPCPDAVTLFIGPEGGFTEAEARAAVEAGARLAGMGRRILRAETAAVAAAPIIAAAAEGA